VPYLEFAVIDEIERPELQLFDLQSNIFEAGKALSSVKRMPQFFAYGQAGVGMPGYNMLSDQVDTYYLIGAGVQWNIWDWNSTKREKQILEKRKQQIAHSRESFSMNIQAGLERELENLEHYRNTISLDDKMLEMRIGITVNAASKLDNGIISASDYLQVLNEENRIRIGKSTHNLQMLKAIANYKILNGTL
jgi:outer membrane protein TolC